MSTSSSCLRPGLALLAAVAVAGAPGRAPADGPPPLEALLEGIRERHRLPALGGAIVRGGALVEVAATGSRLQDGLDRVTKDDRWHLGSCTKAMTATLAAIQVERRRLAWTSTLEEVFPELAEGMHPAWRAVTLEQLLSHRAGAPADLDQDGLWGWLWRNEGPLLAQRRRVVEVVTKRPPVHAPGSAFLYSNGGYIMAGAMLERAGGRAWEALLHDDLLAPLGMLASGTGPPGVPDRIDQPRGHRLHQGRLVPVEPYPIGLGRGPPPGQPVPDNPPALGPAGTVHASLQDWAKFVQLHLAGARGEKTRPALRPETFAELHRPRGDGYALGWGVADRPWAGAGKALSHAGSNTMWFAVTWLAPAKDLAVLVTTNAATETATKAADEAAGLLIQRASR